MKKILISALSVVIAILSFNQNAHAQIKYDASGLTIGNTTPYSFYSITTTANGIYFKVSSTRFFQLDCTTASPRLAGHGDQIVFYNSQEGKFNSIQVNKVLNYSDANAKTSIANFNCGLDIIKELRPVSYNFTGSNARMAQSNKYTGSNAEIGLLAQELETVLPNLVFTDDEGRKLVDYISLVPVLIDAVQSLQKEIEILKDQIAQ